jgi:hypothetical protein
MLEDAITSSLSCKLSFNVSHNKPIHEQTRNN